MKENGKEPLAPDGAYLRFTIYDLRFTIWKIPRRWRNLAERERSGIFETMQVVGSKATGVSPCHLPGSASIVHRPSSIGTSGAPAHRQTPVGIAFFLGHSHSSVRLLWGREEPLPLPCQLICGMVLKSNDIPLANGHELW